MGRISCRGVISADAIARWHLELAGVALVAGCLVVVLGTIGSWRTRILVVAGLLGAALGGFPPLGQFSWRSWLWLLASIVFAVIALVVGDGLASVGSDGRAQYRAHPLGNLAPMLTVVSLIGVWSAVPDTEPPLAAACVLFPLALRYAFADATRSGSPMGPVGPIATASLSISVIGAGWVGSAGRGAALATVCVVGMIPIAPLVLGFDSIADDSATRSLSRQRIWLLAAVHLVAALLLPRIMMRRSVGVASLIAATVVCLMASVVYLVGREDYVSET